MSIIFRPAIASEWQTIQELNSQVFQADQPNDPDIDLTWPDSKAGISYYKKLSDGTYGHCIVAEQNGILVGYVALARKIFDYRKSTYIEVENIGVRPEFRSSGIGSQLMDKAAEWAKAQGADRLYVAAYFGNQKAIQFYERNHFSKIGVELERVL
jgi:GNAT superfamily N-acetyltransferase